MSSLSLRCTACRTTEAGGFATEAKQDEELHMTPDPHHSDVTHLRDLYLAEQPNYKGRFTTPALSDTKSNRIISNESSDIIRMLNSAFDDFVPSDRCKKVDLYPQGQRCDIDVTNDWIYRDINDARLPSRICTIPGSLRESHTSAFSALDRVEAHLSDDANSGPYYHGDCLTEVDVRLYPTLWHRWRPFSVSALPNHHHRY